MLYTSSSIIMAQIDLPLPEIIIADSQDSWTRFELIANAKEWNKAKKKLKLPTLLCGKLLGSYVALDEVAHSSMGNTGPPIHQPMYQLSEALKATVHAEVQQMSDNNIIRLSASPWSSLVVMGGKERCLMALLCTLQKIEFNYPLRHISTP